MSTIMESPETLGKRKASSDETPTPEPTTKRRSSQKRACVHEVAVPNGYTPSKDEAIHGTLDNPLYNGDMAKTYPFQLDPFQSISVACLERKESILVSAHTSAGKTAVAEYAIAMAFRDKQRVIYTSPLKALSNQKYRELQHEFHDVGLMTGDVTISPNASCLVMTTEILRAMLYRGSEVLKEVAWVIFDEIHYMKDRERGVVWEESIIFLPPAIKMVFLSATMSNATEFAEWICYLHKQPCHVVYTDFRPTPLQHYAFPMGGSGLYLVVDENEQFREANFIKMHDTFPKPKSEGKKSANGKSGGRGGAKGGGGGGGDSDVYKIVKMIMERKFQPVIIFSFSRRECENHALSMSKLDFNTEEEKSTVEEVFNNAMLCLNEEDRSLSAIEMMLPLLQRGIAVHHSGLLPVLKELVELLFQEGLVKALFATETFAMGLNMPAKTVVFTAVKKWDGDSHRFIGSGEYIQMSGRAGRRGKDERGICIIMIDEQMEMDVLKDMMLGKPAPLLSTFRLSYYTILNLLSRAEGQFTAEHVIKHSFHQFQYEKALPDIENKVTKLEEEAAILDASGKAEVAEYHKLKLDIAPLEKKLMSEIIRPERVLCFLDTGRLVKIREGGTVEVDAKNPSLEARQRWRSSVSIVKNRARRFRMISNLETLAENDKKRCQIQEKIRVAFYVQKAALQFIDAGARTEYKLTDEVKQAGFYVEADELASMVRNHDTKSLKHSGGAEGIAQKVSVSVAEGVRSSELHIREKIYGANRYAEKPARSFFTFVWEALQDVTLIILMVCAVVSIGVGVATEGFPKGMYDGTGILLSIILVVMVTAISDYRQSLQFRDLDREKKKINIQVTRDGNRQEVSIDDLVVGDVVHLSIGDRVPADGIFISGYNLEIDESSLSGESEPSHVNKEKPFLLSGTKVQNGSAKMLVTTVGMRTEWGKLMETLSEGGEDETPLQVKLNGVATIIGKIGLGFAVLTFVVLCIRFVIDKATSGSITQWSSEDALALLDYFAIAVTIIVVAVPEGLPLAVTLSLAFAMKQLMRDRALVRHLSACETMGSSTCICTDKTGTLTTNHMVVNKVWICENVKERQEETFQLNLSEQVKNLLIQAIFQNTGSEVVKDKEGKTQILGSPTERAILEFGLLLGGDVETQRREHKILKIEPFNSDKKKMSVLTSHSGGSVRAFCKGASEIVLKMCEKVVDSNGESVPLSEEKIAKISEVIEEFASEALRTLCLVYTDLDQAPSGDLPDGGYTLVAVVGIKDPVRPGVREAVQTCQNAGITVRMVTGDNLSTAKAIAKECGILTAGGVAIEGSTFRNMPPHEMRAILPKIQVMARSLPLDKHTLVNNLRKIGEVVAVTGDGTNDAPALHESDIGLAMGIAGTEVAKENADVIIMDDNFATIVNVARWGRAVYINIQKFVQFQLTVNVVALIINFVSACITGSAPLTAVQLLWVNMIMDTLGALALATEPPNEGLMKRQPIGRTASFITRAMWRNIIGQSIYQLIVLGILNFSGKQILNLEGPDSTAVLNTIIFNSFVFCQVFNEVNSREIEKINVFKGMFNSWVFVAVMTATVGFQVIIVEFLGAFASTVPLSWQHWLLCIVIGAISMILAVGLKCIPVESNSHHDGYELLPSGPSDSA